MKRREWIFFGLCAAAYVAARGPAALVGPFILPFENAFQEAIALHHLGHVWDNRFLPVFARIDGVNFYHTAHPPLLHLFYAALYSVFGAAEWVTRAAALCLYLASVALWRRTGADADEPGWPLYPLALFLPVPFVLATTTNYEPLSIFFVSLIFYLAERNKMCERLQSRGLILALVFGLLTDWPVYLAVPALLIRHWREPRRRNLYLGLIAFEAAFLALLLGYMHAVAGEVALFGHAAQRANPVGLFSPALWRELGTHWLELSGAAATIVSAAAVLTVFRRSFRGRDFSPGNGGREFVPGNSGREFIPGLKTGTEVPATDSTAGNKFPATAFELFALFTVILVLAAPQLVSRHHVYLLYFAPPIALALKDLILRVDQKKLAVLALIVLFAAPNYIVRYQRNPAYWAMAERVKGKGIKTAFASAAIGAWYYYAGIETVFPMSAASSKWEAKSHPSMIHLDLKSPEVEDILQRRTMIDVGTYSSILSLGGEEVLVAPETRNLFPQKRFCPIDEFTVFKGKPVLGFMQHPQENPVWSGMYSYRYKQKISFQPAIIHVLPGVKSDGVQFLIWVGGPQKLLKYSLFLPDGVSPDRVTIYVENSYGVRLTTIPGPLNNDAFDDAWWIEPLWEPNGYATNYLNGVKKESPELWLRLMEGETSEPKGKGP